MAEHELVDEIGPAGRMPRGAIFASAAAGAAVTLLGLVVIVGWHTETALLVRIHPVSNAMRYNTAVAFVLSGLALVALTQNRLGLGALLGAGAAAIGLLRFVEYALGIDVGSDHLLFDSRGMAPPFGGYQMSPITAVCFVLTGTATVLLGIWPVARHQPVIVGFLGAIAAAMGAARAARTW